MPTTQPNEDRSMFSVVAVMISLAAFVIVALSICLGVALLPWLPRLAATLMG